MSYEDELQKFVLNFFISGTTAAFCKTLVAPIDRIKLIIQNQDSALQILTGERKKYNGILDVIARLPKEQGVRSFWRGNGTNLIRYFPAQALNFSFRDLYRSIIYEHWQNERMASYLGGGFAGITSTAVVYPLEFCQTKLTVDVGTDDAKSKVKREFSGLHDCLKKVSNRDGLKGLYRGGLVVVMGCGVYRSAFFGLYEDFKHSWRTHHDDDTIPWYAVFFMAQISSALSGFVSYPLDTLGRRLMLDSGRPIHLRVHRTVMSAARHIYAADGIYGFFKGWAANMLRSIGGALILVSYDGVLYLTDWKGE